jgi:uncharacterized protein with ParB-like and HNH nuclease domain
MDKMKKVWRIGSNWGGDYKPLSLFMDYGVAFFDPDSERIGHYNEVNPGDLLMLSYPCQLKTAVIAEAVGKAEPLFGLVPDSGRNIIDYKGAVGIRFINPYWLEDNEDIKATNKYRFCAQDNYEVQKAVNALYEKKRNSDLSSNFDIDASTVSLFGNGNEEKKYNGIIVPDHIYLRVPIYQRPYSWREDEVERLLEDIYSCIKKDEPHFFGPMQFSSPIVLDNNLKAYDIIDGQQRLTTFLLIIRVLELKGHKMFNPETWDEIFRTRANKGTAETNWIDFLNVDSIKALESSKNKENIYTQNAYFIHKSIDDTIHNSDISIEKIAEYLKSDKIKLVVMVTKASISKTIEIFNTINTAGMDLGFADIFKLRFFDYRKKCGDPDEIFNVIAGVYGEADEWNRSQESKGNPLGYRISMNDALRIWQRVIIAEFPIKPQIYRESPSIFFENLFVALEDDKIDSRKGSYAEIAKQIKYSKRKLEVGEFRKVVKTLELYYEICENNEQARVWRALLWDTRYGEFWDFAVVALYYKEQNVDSEKLNSWLESYLKELVAFFTPSSLYFGKKVNAMFLKLNEVLNEMVMADDSGKEFNDVLPTKIKEDYVWSLHFGEMFKKALEYPFADNAPGKNLLCRLIEFNDYSDSGIYERLFGNPFDIEHIQSATDEKDPDAVLKEWGDELNRIGNLVLLERSENRSQGNHQQDKQENYRKSIFKSANNLSELVSKWSMEYAINRRKAVTDNLINLLNLR